jgi:hypothetical protein
MDIYEAVYQDSLWVIKNYGSEAGERAKPGSRAESQAKRIATFVKQYLDIHEAVDLSLFTLLPRTAHLNRVREMAEQNRPKASKGPHAERVSGPSTKHIQVDVTDLRRATIDALQAGVALHVVERNGPAGGNPLVKLIGPTSKVNKLLHQWGFTPRGFPIGALK